MEEWYLFAIVTMDSMATTPLGVRFIWRPGGVFAFHNANMCVKIKKDKEKKVSENMKNKTKGRPMANNKSNTVRSALFVFILICFGLFLVTNINGDQASKTEVPISEVIQRANDPEGDITQITVIGNTLDITLKGKDQPTETSRKDPSGTLYDQGLINYCDGKEAEELARCQETYPVIEYKEDTDVWGVVLDVALTILPIVAVVIFFSWIMIIMKSGMQIPKQKYRLS